MIFGRSGAPGAVDTGIPGLIVISVIVHKKTSMDNKISSNFSLSCSYKNARHREPVTDVTGVAIPYGGATQFDEQK